MASHPCIALVVTPFFHRETGSFSYVAHKGKDAIVVDPVLDFDMASAQTDTRHADDIREYVGTQGLHVHWILETHVHADHLSAANYLRGVLGAPIAIGKGVMDATQRLRALLPLAQAFEVETYFDVLVEDGAVLSAGDFSLRVMATPGHTAESVAYLVDDAVFVGDTVFSPASGTARCDFSGGDAAELHRSVMAILSLPDETRLFHCHDYPTADTEASAQSSVREQRAGNVHLAEGIALETFVAMRDARDRTLPVPRLMLPALQINLRAGALPPEAPNGVSYLTIPLNQTRTKP